MALHTTLHPCVLLIASLISDNMAENLGNKLAVPLPTCALLEPSHLPRPLQRQKLLIRLCKLLLAFILRKHHKANLVKAPQKRELTI